MSMASQSGSEGSNPSDGGAASDDASTGTAPRNNPSGGTGTNGGDGAQQVERMRFATVAPHGPHLDFDFARYLMNEDLWRPADLLVIARTNLHELIKFFEDSWDMSDPLEQKRLARLVLWGSSMLTIQCLTPNGLDIDISRVSGADCAAHIRRQYAVRWKGAVKAIERARQEQEALDMKHEALIQSALEDDSSTYHSNIVNTPPPGDIADEDTEAAGNRDGRKLDFSEITDTLVSETGLPERRTSFGFAGTSDDLRKKKKILQRIETQSPLHRKGSINDPVEEKRLQNSDPSYRDPNLYPKIRERKPIHYTIKYSGLPTDWPRCDAAIKQHFGQCNCPHLTLPDFLETYLDGGYDACLDKYPHLYLNRPQLVADNTGFYYALSSVMNDKCKAIVDEYSDVRDGMQLYVVFQQMFGVDGTLADSHAIGYEAVLERRYTKNYPGGMVRFVNDRVNAYAELEQMGEVYSDGTKQRALMNKLYIPGHNRDLYDHLQTLTSFRKCCDYLMRTVTLDNVIHKGEARRRANLVAQDNPTTPDTLDDLMIQALLARKDVPANLQIPDELFKCIPRESLKAFFDNRSKLIDAESGRRGGGGGGIPSQYGATGSTKTDTTTTRANVATAGDETEDHDDIQEEVVDSSFDEQLELLTRALNAQVNLRRSGMTSRVVHVDLSDDKRQKIRALLSHSKPGHTYTISDVGADTTLCGDGWIRVADTGRFATVQGFDDNMLLKRNLHIGTHVTKVHPTNGPAFLVRAHESVTNEGSKITLYSTFQGRQCGVLIDDVWHKHKRIDGKPGTQRIVFPNPDGTQGYELPLQLRSALLMFRHSKPTQDEYDVATGESSMPIYDLTGEGTWNPESFYDDSAALDYDNDIFMDTPLVIANKSSISAMDDPENSKFYDARAHTGDLSLNDDGDVVDEEGQVFLETVDEPDNTNDGLYYFDPSDDIPEEQLAGHAFHLSIDYDKILISGDVDEALNDEGYDKLCGKEEDDYDSFAYVSYRARKEKEELESLQPFLGFRPLRVIRETLRHTTQMAHNVVRFPMRQHVKSRFPFLNRRRLRETVATDTYFAERVGIGSITCAQVFFGLQSHMINIFPMRSENQFPEVYEDFIREEGCPSVLRRDNAGAETSYKVTDINRKYLVGDEYTEPHNPQQNPSELRGVKFVKDHTDVLLDRCNAPEKVWFYASMYVAQVHNICADESLGWEVPMTKRHGTTVDISPYLIFQFYQKVYFLDGEASFPSSKERAGYWLGVCENVGDLLTFWILTDDTEVVLARSVVRPADDKTTMNKRVEWDPELDPDVDPDSAKEEQDPEAPTDWPGFVTGIKQHFGQAEEDKSDTESDEDLTDEASNIRSQSRLLSKRRRRKQVRADAKRELRKARKDASLGTDDDASVPTDTGEVESEETISKAISPTLFESTDNSGEISDSGETTATSDTVEHANVRKYTRTGRQSKAPNRLTLNVQRRPKGLLNAMTKLLVAAVTCGATLVDSYGMMPPVEPMTATPVEIPDSLDSTPTRYTGTDGLNASEIRKLNELTALDALNEAGEPDDDAWKCLAIIGHKWRRLDPDDIHLKVHALWQNGEETWIRQDAMRLQDPISLAKYAVKARLMSMKGWRWVTDYVSTSSHFAMNVRAHTAKVNGIKYMFGVEVPSGVTHALKLDEANGNHKWRAAIDKELEQLNQYKTFRRLAKGERLSMDYSRVPYHIVFAVKFDGRHKARLVANGSVTDLPKEDTYSGVVSLDTVKLAFVIAEMNGLQACVADIGNAYLYSRNKEKVYIKAGKEFGDLQGETLVIDKALYGLRGSSSRFHEHISAKLRKMGFTPSKVDFDLWMRTAKDGSYEYIGCYVDDVIAFSKDPMSIIEDLRKDYILKGVGKPEYYLGGDVEDMGPDWSEEGIHLGLSAKTYIRNAVDKFEKVSGTLAQHNTPMQSGYHPELDDSPMLDEQRSSLYRSLVGSASWIVTLGRFDIQFAVNCMSRYNLAPRESHLKAMFYLFGYLKKYDRLRVLIDPAYRDNSMFEPESKGIDPKWKEFYPDAEEMIPRDMPKTWGKSARLTVYVDADHASDKVTRRSVTGIIVFLNNTPIRTFSKRQKTVETSTYGAEMVAARIATDIILEIRYSLRMMGVPIDGPALMLGDNRSVILNSTVPSSVLKKKHLSCGYHRIRECIAAGILSFVFVDTTRNVSDCLTKNLDSTAFHRCVDPVLWRTPLSRQK